MSPLTEVFQQSEHDFFQGVGIHRSKSPELLQREISLAEERRVGEFNEQWIFELPSSMDEVRETIGMQLELLGKNINRGPLLMQQGLDGKAEIRGCGFHALILRIVTKSVNNDKKTVKKGNINIGY